MPKHKVYRAEMVISEAEIEAPTAEHALKFARACEGMETGPEFNALDSRGGARFGLTPDIGTRKEKKEASKKDAPQPAKGQTAIPSPAK